MRPHRALLPLLLLALLGAGCPRNPSETGAPDATAPMPPTPPQGPPGPSGTPSRPTAPTPSPAPGPTPSPTPSGEGLPEAAPEPGGSAAGKEGSSAPSPDEQEPQAGERRYRVRDNGTRCITWPCPSWDAQEVETGQVQKVHEVDLSALPSAERERVQPRLSRGGLTVRGSVETVRRPRGNRQVAVVVLRVLSVEE